MAEETTEPNGKKQQNHQNVYYQKRQQNCHKYLCIKNSMHKNNSESGDLIRMDEQCSSYDPSYGSDSCDSIDERNLSIDSNSHHPQPHFMKTTNKLNKTSINNDDKLISVSITNANDNGDVVGEPKMACVDSDKGNDNGGVVKRKSNYKQKQIRQCQGNLENNDFTTMSASGGNESRNDVIKFLCYCHSKTDCLNLKDILKSFNAPISEEQAWALIYQSVKLYREAYKIEGFQINNLRIPKNIQNLKIHKDGSVHISYSKDEKNSIVTSYKKILVKLGTVVYMALDYNLPEDEECMISHELEDLISHMTSEDNDDEGIERDSEDTEGEKDDKPEELDYVIETCSTRVKPSTPEDHYKAVCRALVTEAMELRIFIQKVFQGDTESLRIKASTETSKQELEKLGFNDWARFWMQVVDELRRGVRLKKSTCTFSRPSVEYELTPYEILMEDIRSRKYNLRKVMVNGDIPPRVKKDAHALILEFIRSRPPLKKASERKLPPPIKTTPTAREQLMDSIRKGQSLRPTQTRLKNRRTHQL